MRSLLTRGLAALLGAVMLAGALVGLGHAQAPHLRPVLSAAIDADARAWQAAVVTAGGAVSAPQLARVDVCIRGLKADGIWPLLDRFWPYGLAETSTQALIDFKARAAATAVNSPTFTAFRGYQGNGSTSYINSNYTPSTNGVQHTQNSGSLFSHTNTTRVAADMQSIGYRHTTTAAGSLISPFFTGNIAGGSVNAASVDSTGAVGSVSDVLGTTMVVRTSASSQSTYKRGSHVATNASSTSASPPAVPLFILARTTQAGVAQALDTARVALIGIGGDLSAYAAALNRRVDACLSLVGANA
jgi:hypothetical protein